MSGGAGVVLDAGGALVVDAGVDSGVDAALAVGAALVVGAVAPDDTPDPRRTTLSRCSPSPPRHPQTSLASFSLCVRCPEFVREPTPEPRSVPVLSLLVRLHPQHQILLLLQTLRAPNPRIPQPAPQPTAPNHSYTSAAPQRSSSRDDEAGRACACLLLLLFLLLLLLLLSIVQEL